MASDDKLERLMNLTAALVDAERPLTAEDIQSRVAGYAEGKEAFRRTFERDKDELRELGVPITVVPVPGTFPEEQGYWVERSSYEMPDLGLEPDELAALRFALQAVQVGDPEDTVAGALRRLGGVEDPSRASDIDDATLIADLPVDPSVVPLFSAVLESRVARFSYLRDGTPVERCVEPWHLDFRRGHWYLSAFDVDRGEARNYRLDRIVGDVRLDAPNSFTQSPGTTTTPDLDPWGYGPGEPITAVLWIDPSQAHFAIEVLGQDSITDRHEDGSVTFGVEVTSWPAFRSFVLSFLDHAELIGPSALRNQFVEWLDDIAEGLPS